MLGSIFKRITQLFRCLFGIPELLLVLSQFSGKRTDFSGQLLCFVRGFSLFKSNVGVLTAKRREFAVLLGYLLFQLAVCVFCILLAVCEFLRSFIGCVEGFPVLCQIPGQGLNLVRYLSGGV